MLEGRAASSHLQSEVNKKKQRLDTMIKIKKYIIYRNP